ncbi:MAG: hypothetical protein GF421_05440 [Candidatus Aminicenantes bacterium]|nr:hypothetical protein [Candidatus Aminicenantes bacterium]
MKKNDPSVVLPHRIKNLNRSRAFFIPADTPGSTIKKYLGEKADKKQKLMFSHLFFLKKSVALLGGIGAPAAVLAVEPLLCSGIKELIILGFCGGLSEKLKLFDACLIHTAFSEEGTSSNYMPQKKIFHPSQKLTQEVKKLFQSAQIPIQTASIVSTDAPYRETKEWLRQKRSRGIDTVDMETSALFALSDYHQIHAAAVMLVSDLIKPDIHKKGFSQKRFDARVKDIFFPFFI